MKKIILADHHTNQKEVSTHLIFKGDLSHLISLHIQKGGRLNKHLTNTPAILFCIKGKAEFNDENGFKEIIEPAQYIMIDPMVTHWVDGLEDSEFVLIK
jgi:quercetin dioxygenase-like cupin family protein